MHPENPEEADIEKIPWPTNHKEAKDPLFCSVPDNELKTYFTHANLVTQVTFVKSMCKVSTTVFEELMKAIESINGTSIYQKKQAEAGVSVFIGMSLHFHEESELISVWKELRRNAIPGARFQGKKIVGPYKAQAKTRKHFYQLITLFGVKMYKQISSMIFLSAASDEIRPDLLSSVSKIESWILSAFKMPVKGYWNESEMKEVPPFYFTFS